MFRPSQPLHLRCIIAVEIEEAYWFWVNLVNPHLHSFSNLGIESQAYQCITFLCFIFKILKIISLLFWSQNYSEMEREAAKKEGFHLQVHPRNCHSAQGWTKPKPGAKRLLQVSHGDGMSPGTWTIFCYLSQANSRELDQSSQETAPTLDSGV